MPVKPKYTAENCRALAEAAVRTLSSQDRIKYLTRFLEERLRESEKTFWVWWNWVEEPEGVYYR